MIVILLRIMNENFNRLIVGSQARQNGTAGCVWPDCLTLETPAVAHSQVETCHYEWVRWLPGRNEKGQLGVGDTKRRDVPTLIEALKDRNVVGAACGKNHTLILTGKSLHSGFTRVHWVMFLFHEGDLSTLCYPD